MKTEANEEHFTGSLLNVGDKSFKLENDIGSGNNSAGEAGDNTFREHNSYGMQSDMFNNETIEVAGSVENKNCPYDVTRSVEFSNKRQEVDSDECGKQSSIKNEAVEIADEMSNEQLLVHEDLSSHNDMKTELRIGNGRMEDVIDHKKEINAIEESKASLNIDIEEHVVSFTEEIDFDTNVTNILASDCNRADMASDGRVSVNNIRNENGEQIQLLKCRFCLYLALNESFLKTHLEKNHHNGAGRKFECATCGLTTRAKFHLKKHIRVKHADTREPLFSCNLCEYQTHDRKYLETQHKKRMHDKIFKTFTCGHCGVSVRNKYNLKLHFERWHRKVDEDTLLKCDFCKFKTKFEKSLKSHMHLVHNPNAKTFKCDICGLRAKRRTNLTRHLESVHSIGTLPYNFTCVYCGAVVTRKDGLKRHIEKYHSDVKNQIQSHSIQIEASRENTNEDFGIVKCEICKFTITEQDDFQQHIKQEHQVSRESPLLKCKHCDYKTKWECYLKKHIRMKHNKKAKIYTCTECGMKLKTKCNFDRHVQYQHSERVNKCPQCEFTTKRPDYIKDHIEKKHPKAKKNVVFQKCQLCDYKTEYPAYMKRHLNETHEDKRKTLKCTECQFITKKGYTLKRHIQYQHGHVKFIKCPQCEFTTKREDGLEGHIERIHPVSLEHIVLLECGLCSYKTRFQNDLKNHIRLNHQQNYRKFKCAECGSMYKRKDSLKRHIVRFHIEGKHRRIDKEGSTLHCSLCEYKCAKRSYLTAHITKTHNDSCKVHIYRTQCGAFQKIVDYVSKERNALCYNVPRENDILS